MPNSFSADDRGIDLERDPDFRPRFRALALVGIALRIGVVFAGLYMIQSFI